MIDSFLVFAFFSVLAVLCLFVHVGEKFLGITPTTACLLLRWMRERINKNV